MSSRPRNAERKIFFLDEIGCLFKNRCLSGDLLINNLKLLSLFHSLPETERYFYRLLETG